MAQTPPIAFIDLKAQQDRIRPALDKALKKVLDHGRYIMGPEVGELETQLADFCSVKHAVSCSSGTDALMMVLMAREIGPGDAVICPAFTYTATPEVIALLGATPVFADVDPDSFNIDPASFTSAISSAKQSGLRPRALIAVDLFGQPADYDALQPIAEAEGLFVVADAAQSFGAVTHGRAVGQMGLATATSFFPAKPLGCYGDGGAIFTDDDALADVLRSIRLHGKGAKKYDVARVGINGRLDTLQAAVLIEKLKILSEEIELRNSVADVYSKGLQDVAFTPRVANGLTSVWAQYTLRLKPDQRDAVSDHLKANGVPSQVYYPRPLHLQKAYAHCPVADKGVHVSTELTSEVLSLPMHPYLKRDDQDHIMFSLKEALSG